MPSILLITVIVAASCRGAGDSAPDDDTDELGVDADGDGYGPAEDCDDDDASVFPGAPERCNGEDDDCDGSAEERSTYYSDEDGDGYGDAAGAFVACEQPEGFAASAGDCDDVDPLVHPDAPERCNARDDDCDGVAEPRFVYYRDQDGDGYGVSADAVEDCSPPPGYASAHGDCDDGDALVWPGAPERCNAADDDCDGAPEQWSTWYADDDGDGYGDTARAVEDCAPPAGYASAGGDCDDGEAAARPGPGGSCVSGSSCVQALELGMAESGLYRIDVDGDGPEAALQLYCEQEIDGGGWALVMRTVWDEAETSTLVTTHAVWYAETLGDPEDRSRAYRLAGRHWPALQKKRAGWPMEAHLFELTLRRADGSSCAPLYYEAMGGAYTVAPDAATTLDRVPTCTSIEPCYPFNFMLVMSTDDLGPRTPPMEGAVPWFYTDVAEWGCPWSTPGWFVPEWGAIRPLSSWTRGSYDVFGRTSDTVCGSGAMGHLRTTSWGGRDALNEFTYYSR